MTLRCCRSEPRCRACPLVLDRELRDVRALGSRDAVRDMPPHLAGLPECLHKYAPLLAEQPAKEEAFGGEGAA